MRSRPPGLWDLRGREGDPESVLKVLGIRGKNEKSQAWDGVPLGLWITPRG